MYQKEYYVPKRSGTLADPLLAYGTATVLRALIENAPGRRAGRLARVIIEDVGAHYTIELSEAIREEWLTDARLPDDMAKALLNTAKPSDDPAKPKRDKKPLPDNVPYIDYNEVWSSRRAVSALIEAHKQQHGKITNEELRQLRESHTVMARDRDVALLIGDYRLQVEGIHNDAVKQWIVTREAGHQAANLRAILQLFASDNVDIEEVVKQWAKEVKLKGVKTKLTSSQVYNPSVGKGQNHPKANKLAMGNEEAFWIVEYLKAVGLFVAAIPRLLRPKEGNKKNDKNKKNNKDKDIRKTYVLLPTRIALNNHESIFTLFRDVADGAGMTPIKADVLTMLEYASTYLSHYQTAKAVASEADLSPNPRNAVRGFAVAQYVLLSQNSFTMINLATLSMPPWLEAPMSTDEDIAAVQNVIEEHKSIVRPLKEDYQEESALLDTYRDFLGGRSDAMFTFCAGYGEHVVHTLPEKLGIRQMSVPALDQIIRRIKMSEVDPNDFISTSGRHPGFHNVAYAIRRSTVIPQRQLARFKANEKGAQKPLYDVRYGLGNNLRRKTESVGEFMGALAEFLQLYNAETDQVYETTSDKRKNNPEYGRGRYRSPVAISDLDDILALIKVCKNDVALVCNMLVAYGYAATKSRQEKAASGHPEMNTDSDDSNEEEE